MELPPNLRAELETQLGQTARVQALSGGDINEAARWEGVDGEVVFLKWNSTMGIDMFGAEVAGLVALTAPQVIRVPQVIAMGEVEGIGYLALEWLELGSPRDKGWQNLGRAIADLHRVSASAFGFAGDNYIGRLPQENAEAGEWTAFWRDRRILPMLQLATESGQVGVEMERRIEALCDGMERVCIDHTPAPSLLHGDLWSGNVGFTPDGAPVIYDPAVYYGEREVEMAFTELFGGFDAAFYESYGQAYPLDKGYADRRPFWQLYPLLVHVNHFGAAYLQSLEQAVRQTEQRFF
jgi:protein-ribulosamine 3-kinase